MRDDARTLARLAKLVDTTTTAEMVIAMTSECASLAAAGIVPGRLAVVTRLNGSISGHCKIKQMLLFAAVRIVAHVTSSIVRV